MEKIGSLEKLTIARHMLTEAKSMDDFLKIRNIAESARVYAKAAKLGLENQNEAAEIKIRAERKAGEILEKMEKAKGGQPYQSTGCTMQPVENITPTLQEMGIEKTQSFRWQMLASLPEQQFEEHIAEMKADDKKELTSSGLLRVAKFVKAKLKGPAPELAGKYRIIYADPPWKYGDKLVDGYGPAEYHYPTMSIEELCSLPVKEIAEENSVLFLWVTSPMLEDSFSVINSWGFEYKASFVWDKVKHNMGHYNSVRHEFLLVCTRGNCVPDNMKLYDSVHTIKRTEHSVKPEEFRAIIDYLYPNGKRIELFAGVEAVGWDRWGNE